LVEVRRLRTSKKFFLFFLAESLSFQLFFGLYVLGLVSTHTEKKEEKKIANMHLKKPSVEVVPGKIIKRTVKKVKTYK
jgi:hypothetical protein